MNNSKLDELLKSLEEPDKDKRNLCDYVAYRLKIQVEFAPEALFVFGNTLIVAPLEVLEDREVKKRLVQQIVAGNLCLK